MVIVALIADISLATAKQRAEYQNMQSWILTQNNSFHGVLDDNTSALLEKLSPT